VGNMMSNFSSYILQCIIKISLGWLYVYYALFIFFICLNCDSLGATNIFIYTVFGRREKAKREVEEREIGEKSYTSLVWLWWERGKRELKHVGPTVFRVFSRMRRNRQESSNMCQLPILPLHCIRKRQKREYGWKRFC
jgi:hypothetical protein